MRPLEWLQHTSTYQRLQSILSRPAQRPSPNSPAQEEQQQRTQEQPHNTRQSKFGFLLTHPYAVPYCVKFALVDNLYYGRIRHHYELFDEAHELAQSKSREDKKKALKIFSKIVREDHNNKAASIWGVQVRSELEQLQAEQPENSPQNGPTP